MDRSPLEGREIRPALRDLVEAFERAVADGLDTYARDLQRRIGAWAREGPHLSSDEVSAIAQVLDWKPPERLVHSNLLLGDLEDEVRRIAREEAKRLFHEYSIGLPRGV